MFASECVTEPTRRDFEYHNAKKVDGLQIQNIREIELAIEKEKVDWKPKICMKQPNVPWVQS